MGESVRALGLRRTAIIGVVALLLAVAALGAVAQGARAAEEYKTWFGPAGFTWPADSAWRTLNSNAEDDDLASAYSMIDFVGSSQYPGLYTYNDGTYVYFRLRVAYTGTTANLSYKDTVWVMLNSTGSSSSAPNYAFAWDTNATNHGLEMQKLKTGAGTNPWNGINFEDVDEQMGQKIVPPDINSSGQGYVRTVTGVSVTSPGWNTSATTCTYIDFAVSWSYLATYSTQTYVDPPGVYVGPLPQQGTSWYVQIGSLAGGNDHSNVGTDVGGGYTPTSVVNTTWGSPTLASVTRFAAYAASGGGTLVSWRTGSEAATAGFFLERRSASGRQWVRVNRSLLLSRSVAGEGCRYTVLDPAARPGRRVTYRLIEVQAGGGTRVCGPWTVRPSAPPPPAVLAAWWGGGAAQLPPPDARAVVYEPAQRVRSTPAPDAARVTVAEPGLYALEAGTVARALQLQPAAASGLIKDGGLRLTVGGQPVSVVAEADGSALYFYGEASASPYSAVNVYVLRRGQAARMDSVSAPPGTGAPAVTFRETLHVERDLAPAPSLFHDPAADWWFWSILGAGDPAAEARDVTFAAPGVAGGGSVTVSLHGITASGVTGEHHVAVSLNGLALGDASWTGAVPSSATFPLPDGALRSGDNTLHLLAQVGGAAPYSVVALDSVDVSYERSCVAMDDQLLLTPAADGAVRVGGLSAAGPFILDLADRRSPRLVDGAVAGTDPAGATVTFAAVAGRPYLVGAATAAKQPLQVTGYRSAGLKVAARRGSRYVVVAAPHMAAAAKQLAALRAAGGLSAEVVTTQQIYDEFSYGLQSPDAVRDFVSWARAHWARAPQFVALAGEGSFDYKDALGHGDCLVPTLLVDGSSGLAPSDNALADGDGDGLPDVAVGRIPAGTPAELGAYVAKLKAYESAAGDWRKRVAFVADDTDSGGDFTGDSLWLATRVPGTLKAEVTCAGEVGTQKARAALQAAFTSGSLLVNYLGHAGVEQLGQDSLLGVSDVAGFSNSPRLPVVTAMTCVAGNFAIPGVRSLGEALAVRAGGGAVAVWAPTAPQMNGDSATLADAFLQRLFAAGSGVRLGQAVGAALDDYVAGGREKGVAQTYALLGDPAVKVTW